MLIDGHMYSCGENYHGQLGLGDDTNRYVPTLIEKFSDGTLPNIIQISTYFGASVALSEAGRIYSWGNNHIGQLGLGDTINKDIPTLISILSDKNIIRVISKNFRLLFITNDGKVYATGGDVDVPRLVPNLSNVIQISSGGDFTLILNLNGQVHANGINSRGQLGLGDYNNRNIPTLISDLNNIIQIETGEEYFSLCLDMNGLVYAFGSGYDGQLGLGDNTSKNTPTVIPNLNNIIQMSCSFSYTLVLDAYGQVYGFGGNHHGQLGLGDEISKNTPTLNPYLTNIVRISITSGLLVLKDNGDIYACGYNQNGQLGLGDKRDRTVPELITNFVK